MTLTSNFRRTDIRYHLFNRSCLVENIRLRLAAYAIKLHEMPLRCHDSATDKSILAFDFSPDEWRALAVENSRAHHLLMPCCRSQLILKRSSRGTQFFAHKATGSCNTAPETEDHRTLKRLAVDAARREGWEASLEVFGSFPSGGDWRADVLATKAGRSIAIEIQWSSQTDAETFRRQSRYAQLGIEGIWLFRQRNFPIAQNIAAARINVEPEGDYSARLPTGQGSEQSVKIDDFFSAVFRGRLLFGLPVGVMAEISVRAGALFCWSCGAETQIIIGIDIELGSYTIQYSIPDLGDHPDLYEAIRLSVPEGAEFSFIKFRYSKTQDRTYLSNGCAHCGVLIGEFHEHEAWTDQSIISQTPVRLTERWRDLLLHQNDFCDPHWAVYFD